MARIEEFVITLNIREKSPLGLNLKKEALFAGRSRFIETSHEFPIGFVRQKGFDTPQPVGWVNVAPDCSVDNETAIRA